MTRVTEGQHGNAAENAIAGVLQSKKYVQLTADLISTSPPEVSWYVPQYRRFTGIYKKQLRLDFYIYHPEKWGQRLAVEVKWQQVGGSADEKYPYVVANLESLGCPGVVFLGGGGYSDGARDWLVSQQTDALIVVVGMDNVIKWCNRNF